MKDPDFSLERSKSPYVLALKRVILIRAPHVVTSYERMDYNMAPSQAANCQLVFNFCEEMFISGCTKSNLFSHKFHFSFPF